jgi:hypothetical protein
VDLIAAPPDAKYHEYSLAVAAVGVEPVQALTFDAAGDMYCGFGE